jgi:hypothetical protein
VTWWEAVAVVLAGLTAGGINAVVGSGTLVTFPVLLGVGLPPVLANVTNTTGLVPGSVAAAVGYRAELRGHWARVVRLVGAAVLGGVTGAILLLVLPDRAFRLIVPGLIALACVLVLLQPRIAAALRAGARHPGHDRTALLLLGVFVTGIYGGYFGAAQGVLLLAVLGVTMDERLQLVNGVKNVLAGVVNAVAALFFVLATDIHWRAAGLVAIGAVVGGVLGARLGRRLPDRFLRGFIVLVGVVAIGQMVATW